MSRMPSTSTLTVERRGPARAAAASTSWRSGFSGGGSTSPSSTSASSGTGGARQLVPGGHDRDERLLEQRLGDAGARCVTGSVTTACASSPLRHLGHEPLRRAPRSTRSRMPGRARRAGRRRAAGTTQRLAVPTMPKLASPTSRPWSIERSARIASSSRRMRRARSSTTSPHSVGSAPAPAADEQLRPELAPRAGGPARRRSTARSRSASAAAVNDPSSAIASRASRWRSSMARPSPCVRHPVGARPICSDPMVPSVCTCWTDSAWIGHHGGAVRFGEPAPPAGSPDSAPAPSHRTEHHRRSVTVAAETVSNLIFTGPAGLDRRRRVRRPDRRCSSRPPASAPRPGCCARHGPARSAARARSSTPCRDWAREHREYGFWGGESEEERAAAGFRVDMPVGRVARYPKGNGTPVKPRESRVA